MKSREAREMLGMSKAEFFQLVEAQKVRIVTYHKGARGHDYDDRDVRRVYAEMRRYQRSSRPRTIITPQVQAAAASLRKALDEAIAESGLTNEEAAGKLSRFISDLWEECEAMTDRLPGSLRAA